MNKQIKLLVLDIDGTLVNHDGFISEADRLALAEARSHGIRISLCTGRSAAACDHVLDNLNLDGCHIFYDGALVFNQSEHKQIFSNYLPPEIVKQACEAALSNGVPLDLFSATQYFAMEESWRTSIRREYFKISPIVTDFRTLWQKEMIIKGSIVTRTPREEMLARDFSAQFEGNLECIWTGTPAFPNYCFINVNNIGISKGIALKVLVGHLEMGLDEVAAIGDGSNDISLLSTAGMAIAMRNSPEELKQVADYITDDVEHSGVANAIRQFII